MLKVGDFVKIKELDIHGSYPSGICQNMLMFSGKIAVISRIASKNNYRISGDSGEYSWNEEMFENGDNPLEFKPGIELKSDIFGKIIIDKITDDPDYPYDIKLRDEDVISVTKDFKYFKDSIKFIF